jgi:hypothetical protein
MRLKNLRSLIAKCSLLGVYILFLSVQLNLKYTFSYATGAHVTAFTNVATANAKGGKLVSIKVKKLAVHQPRLNKRYLYQDPYQVPVFFKHEAVEFFVAPKPVINQVTVLQNAELRHSSLRGPPTAGYSYPH